MFTNVLPLPACACHPVFDWSDVDDQLRSQELHASFGGTVYSAGWAVFGSRLLAR